MSAQGQTAGQAAPTGGAEQEVRQLDRRIAELIVSRDIPTLAPLVDDGYTHTNPFGQIFSKAEIAGAIESGELTVERYDTDDVQVRIYGDAAVLTGRATLEGRFKGQNIGGQYRYTRTYVRQGDGWKVAVTQLTRIAQQ
jgi:ketosteroid isomerase-like protein